jgi:general secretion pathway protein E
MRRIEKIAALSYGMFLVTGPTGSGKSTTLYSTLKMMKTDERKVLTIEDPVEYQIDGVNQIHVNTQIGLTFAAGLRHIVRQDPDVIMVGEIRDRETAEIAVRAALTGHLVLSTLHTNDAASALARLTDMGVERFLLTSSIVGILAQRLVRVLCRQCRKPAKITREWLEMFGLSAQLGGRISELAQWVPGACEQCNHTGYQGRLGIFELIEMNDELRRRVMAGQDAGTIGQAARAMGMKSLVEDGVERVLAGVTSTEELLRVTQVF